MTKKVVVTGATGAIGMALLNILQREQIYTLVLLHKGSEKNSNILVSEFIKTKYCDIEEYNSFEYEESFDIFFHMAWNGGGIRQDVKRHYANVGYSLNALQLAVKLGCKRFVFTGSQAEYGLKNCKLTGTIPCKPINPFGASKLYAGQMTRFLAFQLGIEHVWCRILSVYGPYDGKNTMVSSVLRQLLEGKSPRLTKCEQVWDYLYSEDAAKAIYLCGLKGRTDRIYPICSGEERVLKEYVQEMCDVLSVNTDIKFGEIPYSEDQIMYLSGDTQELVEDTGFQREYSFHEGIEKTAHWMKKYK